MHPINSVEPSFAVVVIVKINVFLQVCDEFEEKLLQAPRKKQPEKAIDKMIGAARTTSYRARTRSKATGRIISTGNLPLVTLGKSSNKNQHNPPQQPVPIQDLQLATRENSSEHFKKPGVRSTRNDAPRSSITINCMEEQVGTDQNSDTAFTLVNCAVSENSTSMAQSQTTTFESTNFLLSAHSGMQKTATQQVPAVSLTQGVENVCSSVPSQPHLQDELAYIPQVTSSTCSSKGATEDHVLVHNTNDECDLMTLIEIQNFLSAATNEAGIEDDSEEMCPHEGPPQRDEDMKSDVSKERETITGGITKGSIHQEAGQGEVHYDIIFDGHQKILVKRTTPQRVILAPNTTPAVPGEQAQLLRMLNLEKHTKDLDLVQKDSDDVGSSGTAGTGDNVVATSTSGSSSADVFMDSLQPFDGVGLVHGEHAHFHDYCITDSMKLLSSGSVVMECTMPSGPEKAAQVPGFAEDIQHLSIVSCNEGHSKEQPVPPTEECSTQARTHLVLLEEIDKSRPVRLGDTLVMTEEEEIQTEVLGSTTPSLLCEAESLKSGSVAATGDESDPACPKSGTSYKGNNISEEISPLHNKNYKDPQKGKLTIQRSEENISSEGHTSSDPKRILPKRKWTERNKEGFKRRKRDSTAGKSESKNSKTDGDRNQCPWCKNAYLSAEHMRAHAKVAHVEHMHKCAYCPRLFVEEGQCDNHMDWCRIGDKVDGRFVCPQCAYSAAKVSYVVEHYRSKHTNKLQRTCDMCGTAFQDLTSYFEHQLQVHNVDVSKIPRRKVHQCPDCDYRTIKGAAYKTHRQGHSTETFVCSQCSKVFKTNDTLKKHIQKIHKETILYKCTICDFTSRYSSTLNAHQYRSHHLVTSTKQAVYYCPYCDYSNVDQADLRKHERNKHSDDRPFLCSFCPKAFKHKTQVTIHERIHTGARPFKCDLCNYAGRSKVALVTHLRHVHSDAKPYVCELCGFRTKGPSNLWFHKARCKKKNAGHLFGENSTTDLEGHVFQMTQIAE